MFPIPIRHKFTCCYFVSVNDLLNVFVFVLVGNVCLSGGTVPLARDLVHGCDGTCGLNRPGLSRRVSARRVVMGGGANSTRRSWRDTKKEGPRPPAKRLAA